MSIADLYIRVSTDEQADNGYSLRDQEERLRRFCSMNNISIGQVIVEDHSAKNFNRPEWSKLLASLKKKNCKTNVILFTKWDRFSRNAGDAYQMISVISKLGIDLQAIEQPLDLSIPENKMMLAIYLAAPEVENDRRALNTFHGMRRAKKEGRVMGKAPFGYINRNSEDGKQKYIVPKEPEASIIKEIFKEIANQIESPETIRRRFVKKGVKILSKQAFHVAIRNPVYCGKIFIEKYKDENAHFVKGQHESLITDELFDAVQYVLDGNKRSVRTNFKLLSESQLPLRGFLICPRCGGNLTGSGSKGRNGLYYYYHCRSSCGFRHNAADANDRFVKELKKYEYKPCIKSTLQEILILNYKQFSGNRNNRRKQISDEIDSLNKLLSVARNKLLTETIDDLDYQAIKSEYREKIKILEGKLQMCCLENGRTGIESKLQKALSTLGSISTLYQDSDLERKRYIIDSIYPEKLVFDGSEYRTARVNIIAKYIFVITNGLGRKKDGNDQKKIDHSRLVAYRGIEPLLQE